MLSWDYQAKATNEVSFVPPEKNKVTAMKEYNKLYRERHSGYVECGCGAIFREISKYTHGKSARHVKWVQNTSTNPSG
jgi:hypothetical protein